MIGGWGEPLAPKADAPSTRSLEDVLPELRERVGETARISVSVMDVPVSVFEGLAGVSVLSHPDVGSWLSAKLEIHGHDFGLSSVTLAAEGNS